MRKPVFLTTVLYSLPVAGATESAEKSWVQWYNLLILKEATCPFCICSFRNSPVVKLPFVHSVFQFNARYCIRSRHPKMQKNVSPACLREELGHSRRVVDSDSYICAHSCGHTKRAKSSVRVKRALKVIFVSWSQVPPTNFATGPSWRWRLLGRRGTSELSLSTLHTKICTSQAKKQKQKI